jgi:hypothetical protein
VQYCFEALRLTENVQGAFPHSVHSVHYSNYILLLLSFKLHTIICLAECVQTWNVFSYVATTHVCNFYMGPYHKFYSTPLNYRIVRMKLFSSPLTRSRIVHNRTWCNTQIAASSETTGHRQYPRGRRKSMFRHF